MVFIDFHSTNHEKTAQKRAKSAQKRVTLATPVAVDGKSGPLFQCPAAQKSIIFWSKKLKLLWYNSFDREDLKQNCFCRDNLFREIIQNASAAGVSFDTREHQRIIICTFSMKNYFGV